MVCDLVLDGCGLWWASGGGFVGGGDGEGFFFVSGGCGMGGGFLVGGW